MIPLNIFVYYASQKNASYNLLLKCKYLIIHSLIFWWQIVHADFAEVFKYT